MIFSESAATKVLEGTLKRLIGKLSHLACPFLKREKGGGTKVEVLILVSKTKG